MPSARSSKALVFLGLLGGIALLAGAGRAGTARATKPGGSSSPTPDCPYPPPGPPAVDKGRWDLIDRIYARILEVNPALGRQTCRECGGRSVAHVVAGALAQAEGMGVPVDLVVAVARRESTFNPHVDRVAYALQISQNGAKCASGSEIGPLQVKPCAFRQVGMDPTLLLNMPVPARVQYATAAGIRYLAWLKGQFSTWCDVLHAYNRGPTAFRQGERAPAYVADIIQWAGEYSELRV